MQEKSSQRTRTRTLVTAGTKSSGKESLAKSKSSQALRERNVNLKQEVEKLTRRLRKMEDSITRFAI